METIEQEMISLIGLSLKHQTTNANGQSAIDCGTLWQEFMQGNYADRITSKVNENILAVYHAYEGDHTQPYSYFIGCRVVTGTLVPEGLDSLLVLKGNYQMITAKGKMPDCVADAWHNIWKSDLKRAYRPDFEVYDNRSTDWQNAEVDIYLSV